MRLVTLPVNQKLKTYTLFELIFEDGQQECVKFYFMEHEH